MLYLFIKIFTVSAFVNLLYELLHSALYKTCLEASFEKYWKLMIKACLFDGLAITLIYYFSRAIFQNFYLISFSVISLVFAYGWEVYSVKKGKWEYSKNMPIVFGVGLTPLIQLLITGIFTFY